MTQKTIYLARLLGLFCIVVALCMFVNKPAMLDFVSALVQNHSLLMIVGMIGVGVGLAIVLAHNVWSGGVLPIVVTLVGWVTLIRGIVQLCLPMDVVAHIYGSVDLERIYYVPAGLVLVLGLYLTYAGFAPRALRAK